MIYSQMKDERLLAFYENVRQQVALDAGSRYRFAGDGVRAYADCFAKKWTDGGLGSRPLIGRRTAVDDG
jgi:hypothetical protein